MVAASSFKVRPNPDNGTQVCCTGTFVCPLAFSSSSSFSLAPLGDPPKISGLIALPLNLSPANFLTSGNSEPNFDEKFLFPFHPTESRVLCRLRLRRKFADLSPAQNST